MRSYIENAYIDLDVDEVMDMCNEDDIQEIIEWLTDEGHLQLPNSTGDTIWNEQIRKLYDARHLLTVEEEETITNITKKLL